MNGSPSIRAPMGHWPWGLPGASWTDSSGQKHSGLKALVKQNYAVDRVEEITGVPVETIIRIAREFARNRPAIAMAEQEVAMHTAGLYARMAVHCLNAPVGSIDTP